MKRANICTVVLVAITAWSANGATQDASSPQAAARSLFDAVDRADEAALRELLYADLSQPRQVELIAANARMVIQGKRLADAAREKFPGASDAMTQRVISADDLAALDKATVEETGDTAVLKFPGSAREMRFRRTGEKWKLVIAEMAGATDQNLSEQIVFIGELADAFSQAAGEIAAGKYPTPQEAETALQAKINIILAKSVKLSAPATAPATDEANSPSTAPSR